MTKTEDIIKKCIEANSEIVELKFGCVGKDTDGLWVKSYNGWQGIDNKGIGNKNWSIIDPKEIIGRPIRLADVSLALEQTKYATRISMGTNGMIVHSTVEKDTDCRWNLKDNNLENQSKETIDFIHGLLYG